MQNVEQMCHFCSSYLCSVYENQCLEKTVPWIRQLVASLSLQMPTFNPRSDRVGFVVDKVALWQVFLQVLLSSPVNIITPVIHAHSSSRSLTANGK
jgi:hypothetical protein